MISVLHKACNILELLASDVTRDIPLAEIAASLDMDKGTCANILKTLKSRGYVDQRGPRKGYKLGYMVYRVGDIVGNNAGLIDRAVGPMARLGKQFNESIILSTLRQDKRILLHQVMPDQDIVVRTHPETPAYRATTGRMLLSYLTNEELFRFVRLYGLPKPEEWEGVQTLEDLVRELDRGRARGWRQDVNRNHVIGFAVPVWKGDKVVAGLGAYLPEFRCTDNFPSDVLAALKEAADEIR